MKKMILTIAAVLSVNSMALAAENGSFEDISMATGMTTLWPFFLTGYTTYGTLSKVVVDAKEDINLFIASEGEVRTVRFENAMSYVKGNFDTANASELEIAQALLAQ